MAHHLSPHIIAKFEGKSAAQLVSVIDGLAFFFLMRAHTEDNKKNDELYDEMVKKIDTLLAEN